MLVVQVDTVAIYGSRASEATKKPKGSYCQAWPTPRQVLQSLILLPGGFITLLRCNRAPV